MKRLLLAVTWSLGIAWVSSAFPDQKASFIEGCLKANGSTQGQCECMHAETSGEIPTAEATFLIASIGGDTAAIQQAAADLSPEEIQRALTTWPARMEKCF